MFRFTNTQGEEVSCIDYELSKARLHTVLCKSNDSEFRGISCSVLNEISPKFRRTFALETCEISRRLSEISKGLTKFHRIFAQEKCEISKGETNLLSKCVRNFVLPERATVSFDVGSVMAALSSWPTDVSLEHKYACIISYFAVFVLSLTANSS